jgi:exonuclease SbcD
VILISGNHDDGVRLSAAAPLSEEQGIYIVGNERRLLDCGDNVRAVYPTESGKGYAVFTNEKGERIFVSFLPYPNEARFKEEKSELPYVEQMQKWMNEGQSNNVENLPSIFVGHLFVAGGMVSESEREIDLGGARAIPIDALPNCDYIALGHLHKKQHFGKGHCYYSGSPLQYAFDESADKGVKVFDLTTDGVQNLKDVSLTRGKKLIRLQADGVESAVELLKKHPDELVEMKLFLTAPLVSSDSQTLSVHKNLVSLLAEVHTEETIAFESRKGLSGEKLFELFYQTNYGVEPKEELKTLFLQTLAELDEE